MTVQSSSQEEPNVPPNDAPVEGTPPENPPAEGVPPAAAEVKPAGGAEEETTEEKEKRQPWFQKRIDKLTAQKAALQQQLETALLRVNTPKPAEPGSPQNVVPPQHPQGIDPEAMRLAQQIVEQQQFAEKCNNLVDTGKEKYGEAFEETMQNMRAAGAIGEVDPGFIQAVLDLENPVKVFHTLGQDPDEATRLLNLPPRKQIIELARLDAKLTKPPVVKISQAPPPITPVGGAAKAEVSLEDPKLSMEAWIEQRNKTRRSRQ